jgi:hypothetical protein
MNSGHRPGRRVKNREARPSRHGNQLDPFEIRQRISQRIGRRRILLRGACSVLIRVVDRSNDVDEIGNLSTNITLRVPGQRGSLDELHAKALRNARERVRADRRVPLVLPLRLCVRIGRQSRSVSCGHLPVRSATITATSFSTRQSRRAGGIAHELGC